LVKLKRQRITPASGNFDILILDPIGKAQFQVALASPQMGNGAGFPNSFLIEKAYADPPHTVRQLHYHRSANQLRINLLKLSRRGFAKAT
jgi:hypothetical protein